MAIVKMNKLSLIGLAADKLKIIDHLMKIGAVDVSDITNGETSDDLLKIASKHNTDNDLSNLDSEIAKIKSAIQYLSKYNTVKKGLFDPKKSVDTDTYNKIIGRQKELKVIVNAISDYDERLSVLKSEINKHQNMIDSMQPWKTLDIPFEDTNTKNTVTVYGTVPGIFDVNKLESDIKEQVPESYFEILNTDKDQSYTLLIYHISVETAMQALLKQYGFARVNFKDMNGTPAQIIDRAVKAIENIEKEQKTIAADIAALAHENENLEVLFDHLTIQRDRTGILNKLVKTDSVFYLQGWLPEESGAKVKDSIRNNFECYVDISEPEEKEEFPVLLKNNTFVRSFEIITELYSLPNSRGIDPNAVLAPFYFVFFGMMVSDAGYGLIIAILSGIVLLKLKPEGMFNKIMSLLFFGGISTFIWGAVFGSWFGDVVDVLSGKAFTIPPLWFNPLNDPMRLLIWSFIFGVIHLFAGMGLKGYMLIKEGKKWDALFDVGFWYLMLVGLCMLFLGGTFAQVGKYMAIVGAILLVLTQGRAEKNIVKKFFSGVLSLYNTVGFMSDVFSYSRLLALGLATGVISSVINTIGTLMGFTVPGILMMIFAFAVGHTFNLAINALGAYVHASRLQYVEFFGKFYEGGGKAYQPFKINTKYIHLNDRRTE